ncbi:MAG TPA: carboxylating nicotinate-nucleotide diphosphorylase [Candidatus Dormibacteraeota bacterium]|nr:carboxylating nicotinate-nucleotide diphosphorylase [Candidatus Dormibacteraeota bacterium]
MSRLDPTEVASAVERALAEDYRGRDLTGEAVLTPGQSCRAQVIAREPGVLCGIDLAEAVFHQIDAAVSCRDVLADGSPLTAGTVVMQVAGPAAAVLAGERTALNFLQHLCGIASLTAQYVALASPYGATILDTRKTVPGLRYLEKYAARTGGAHNHRMGLYDAVLIKDNHVDLAGGLKDALEQALSCHPARDVEVEVRSQEELLVALEAGVGRVLLDNFSPVQVADAVRLIQHRAAIEVSGGVSLENLAEYAAAGPDYISVGRLTHSAPALDLALKVRLSA